MKNLIISLLIIPAFVPMLTSAQIKTTDQSRLKNPGSTLRVNSAVLSKKIEIKSTSFDNLKKQVAQGNSIKNLEEIKLSPEEIERARIKSWEITPQRPFSSGLTVWLLGSDFTPDGFFLQPRPTRIGSTSVIDYYFFSMFLECNLTGGKDFKLILDIKNQDQLPVNSGVAVSLGEETYRVPVQTGQKQITVFFTNTSSGNKRIGVSPLISNTNGRETWGELGITKIKLEELVPAG